MVYIAIIGVYCVMFSLGCYFFMKQQCELRMDEELLKLEDEYKVKLNSLEVIQRDELERAKKVIFDQNKQYLSQMSKDVSNKLETLSNTIKNTRIV